MKKVVSLIIALVLMICAVASVSAAISPPVTEPDDEIIIEAIPVPGEGGGTTPDINNPGRVEVGSGEEVTLTAIPSKGYQFSHWEFVYGEYVIVEGSLTTPVLVIRPTGSSNIRAEAHFVKIGETVNTAPESTPAAPLDTDPVSPTTGSNGINSAAATGTIIAVVVIAMTICAAVVLKKKASV